MLAADCTYKPVSGEVSLSDQRNVHVSIEGLGARFDEVPE
jgi:hypothetical protein